MSTSRNIYSDEDGALITRSARYLILEGRGRPTKAKRGSAKLLDSRAEPRQGSCARLVEGKACGNAGSLETCRG